MLFPKEFINQVRSRFNVSQIVGKRVALKQRGKEFTGLCPFHNEKSPSFTVNDEKEFYHCFGCGAHGNMFDFIMQTEGLNFPETVEILALEAGMQLPKADPKMVEKYDHLAELMSCAEAAAKYFKENLHNNLGAAARGYIERRGLSEQTVEEFRLGFCPDIQGRMQQYLTEKGFNLKQMGEIGLIRNGYEIFRSRLIFPITDNKGRVIAFGGRILEKGEPKYLNSPETPIFHKRRILFGKSIARKYSHETGEIIVTEGYMDTISLNQAGFKNAVAPLGTSLTEEHLSELWALAKEPSLCFDGDNAGKRAAQRAAMLALPLLKPGYSLKFVELPAGQDPDDVVKQSPATFRNLLNAASPLSEVVYNAEKQAKPVKTPEQQADLRARLENLARNIKNPDISKNYLDFFRQKLWQDSRSFGQKPALKTATGNTSQISGVIGSEAEKTKVLRLEYTIIGLVASFPELLNDTNTAEELANIEFSHLEIDNMRQNILFTTAYETDEGNQETPPELEQLTEGLDKKLSLYIKYGKDYAQKWGNPKIAWEKLIEQYRLLLAVNDCTGPGSNDDLENDFIRLQETRRQLREAENKFSFGD